MPELTGTMRSEPPPAPAAKPAAAPSVPARPAQDEDDAPTQFLDRGSLPPLGTPSKPPAPAPTPAAPSRKPIPELPGAVSAEPERDSLSEPYPPSPSSTGAHQGVAIPPTSSGSQSAPYGLDELDDPSSPGIVVAPAADDDSERISLAHQDASHPGLPLWDIAPRQDPTPAPVRERTGSIKRRQRKHNTAAETLPAVGETLTGGFSSGPAPAEDPDRVLAMLEDQALFERPSEQGAKWATKKEAKRPTTRTGPWMIALCLAGALAGAGALYGYEQYMTERDGEATRLIEEALEATRVGGHAELLEAQAKVRQAIAIDARRPEALAARVIVLATRALEDGDVRLSSMRDATEALRLADEDSPLLGPADALLLDMSAQSERAAEALAALPNTPGDYAPTINYLVGSLGLRVGLDREAALTRLRAAVVAEPNRAAAALALAEAEFDAGARQAAAEAIDQVLGTSPNHLRASLWKAFFEAPTADPATASAALDALAERLGERPAASDTVLLEVTRATLLLRQDQTDQANAAIERAVAAGTNEARLLALIARGALAIGNDTRALETATRAVGIDARNPRYHALLGEVHVARRDGVRALAALARVQTMDGPVLALSARAALMAGRTDALRAAEAALTAHIDANDDASPLFAALRLRARQAAGVSGRHLRDARRLLRRAGDDHADLADLQLAVAETALAQREADLAHETLTALLEANARHAEAHFLMGRTARMRGDADAAEASFRRAAELVSTYDEANIQLGYLLLDQGKYAEAETLYAAMAATPSPITAGLRELATLGRVEAALGRDDVEAAQGFWGSVPDEAHSSRNAEIIGARLALARGEPAAAVEALRPLTSGDRAATDIIALYADALYAADRTSQASEAYERALAQDEAHPEALLGFATVLFRGEKLSDASVVLDRAEAALRRRIRPPSVLARVNVLRARIMLETDLRTQARQLLQRTTAGNGAPAEAWFYLGEALAGENSPAAREAYQRYLELAPAGPLATRARRAIN